MTSLFRPRTILVAAIAVAAIAATGGCMPLHSPSSSSPSGLHSPRGHRTDTWSPVSVPTTPSSDPTTPTSAPTTPSPDPTTPTWAPTTPSSDPTTPSSVPTTPTSTPTTTPTSTPTTTPTSTPTTTPTSTPTTTPTSTPTSTCVTSAAQGLCGPYTYPAIQGTSQGPQVGQDVWNPISGWQQTLYATSPGNFYVIANMPAGNTAVVSYPDVGSYYERALSTFSTMYSSFTENMNATSRTEGWAAYDIWLNGGKNEVMIQHDASNRGACTIAATESFGGSGGVPVQSWNLCVFGSEDVWWLPNNEQSGTVDILSMLTWMESHSYLPQSSTLNSIGYGWEISSTGGVNEKFQVSSFSITTS